MTTYAPSFPTSFLTPPVDSATRRQFLGILVAAGLVSGCGADDEPAPVSSPSSDGFPRAVRTARGDAVLPRRPERVVAKYPSSDLDAVYALGVVPVAIMSGFPGGFPWHDETVRSIPTLVPPTLDSVDWDIELVAAERPDLIVCQDGEYDKAAKQLQRLATCLVLDANVDPGWRNDTRLAGQTFALETRAEEVIAATEAVIAEAKQRVASLAGRTVRLLEVGGASAYFLRSSASLLGKLVIELGLAVPDKKDYASISEERLGDVGGTDLLLVESYDDKLTDAAVRRPVFGGIPQVESGSWARLDAVTGAGASTSALSIRYAAPLLADALLSAAEAGKGQRF